MAAWEICYLVKTERNAVVVADTEPTRMYEPNDCSMRSWCCPLMDYAGAKLRVQSPLL